MEAAVRDSKTLPSLSTGPFPSMHSDTSPILPFPRTLLSAYVSGCRATHLSSLLLIQGLLLCFSCGCKETVHWVWLGAVAAVDGIPLLAPPPELVGNTQRDWIGRGNFSAPPPQVLSTAKPSLHRANWSRAGVVLGPSLPLGQLETTTEAARRGGV